MTHTPDSNKAFPGLDGPVPIPESVFVIGALGAILRRSGIEEAAVDEMLGAVVDVLFNDDDGGRIGTEATTKEDNR